MRSFLMPIALGAILLTAGCALPDDEEYGYEDILAYEYVRPDDEIVMPGWAERSPSAADVRKVYPETALNQEIEARVVLLCTIQPSRDLVCTVDTEETPGYGFGQAALAVAGLFRVKPAEPDAPTSVGRQVRVPIRFAVG
jgi:TonB family protein